MAFCVIGVGVWLVAQTLVALVVYALLAIPIAVLFVFDALATPRDTRSTLQLVPPAPPRQPFAVPLSARRAA
ncbi:MAG TPA: hypothetical protein VH914_11085 [Acidimicrobiia bacterium]|nr:hypothetical protein [Acidimicrobiia bacterium]